MTKKMTTAEVKEAIFNATAPVESIGLAIVEFDEKWKGVLRKSKENTREFHDVYVAFLTEIVDLYRRGIAIAEAEEDAKKTTNWLLARLNKMWKDHAPQQHKHSAPLFPNPTR
jgi:hypothetical protein